MISGLIKLADHLDSIGRSREANYIDNMIVRLSEENKPGDMLGSSSDKKIRFILNKEMKRIRTNLSRTDDPGPTPDGNYHAKGFGVDEDAGNIAREWNKSSNGKRVSYSTEDAPDGGKKVVWTIT